VDRRLPSTGYTIVNTDDSCGEIRNNGVVNCGNNYVCAFGNICEPTGADGMSNCLKFCCTDDDCGRVKDSCSPGSGPTPRTRAVGQVLISATLAQ
jgi:hypothetical protein